MRHFLAIVLALASAVALAEVIELEGTIKSIDADARSIAITRQTPKGEKVLELEIAKNAGDISGLQAGDQISFAYNPDAEIVTKIEKGLSDGAAADLKAFQGIWKVTAEHEFGRVLTKEEMRTRNRHIAIKGTTFQCDRVSDGKLGTYAGTLQLDQEHKAFTFTGKGPQGAPIAWIGIYKLDGDTMTLCYRIKRGDASVDRPTEFKSVSDSPGTILFECKREE